MMDGSGRQDVRQDVRVELNGVSASGKAGDLGGGDQAASGAAVVPQLVQVLEKILAEAKAGKWHAAGIVLAGPDGKRQVSPAGNNQFSEALGFGAMKLIDTMQKAVYADSPAEQPKLIRPSLMT